MTDRCVVLIRQPSASDGTFGDWKSDSGFSCKTLEKPWIDNETNKSCVPTGVYDVLWQWSPKHNCNLYHLQNVPDRNAIEIHSANVQEQLLGCIAVGASIANFVKDVISPGIPTANSKGITLSRATLMDMEKDMRDADGNQVGFTLIIKEAA